MDYDASPYGLRCGYDCGTCGRFSSSNFFLLAISNVGFCHHPSFPWEPISMDDGQHKRGAVSGWPSNLDAVKHLQYMQI